MLIFDQLRKGDRQLRVLSVAVLIGMFILLCGLWYVQVISAPKFRAELQTQSFRTIRVPAYRGKILDRNLQPIAENRPNYNVVVYLDELRQLFQQEFKRIRPAGKLTAKQLAELAQQARYQVVSNLYPQVGRGLGLSMPPLNPVAFKTHYEQRLALPMPMVDNLTPELIARFVERCASIPGVSLEVQASRNYPLKGAAAHLVGYLQRSDRTEQDEDINYHYRLPDFRGASGVEWLFDHELRGRAGAKSMLVNNFGYRQSENTIANAEAGKNLVLTVDVNLQKAAETAMRSMGRETRGAVVVMEVNSGDILTLYSSPAYDPNEFFPRISSEAMERLNDPIQLPLFNRATHAAYQPGSIFKIITGLACLEAGTMSPSDTITNPGVIWIGKRPIHDTALPGNYNFERAFKRSSNTYFIHYGLKAGLERILEMGHRFSLGEITGIMPRQESAGNFPRMEETVGRWNLGNAANVCIGQEITVTPVQMAVMTSAVANGGKVYWPRLVMSLQEPDDLASKDEVSPMARLRGEIHVSKASLDIIRSSMFADVDSEGTGRSASVPGMDVCGKTGTAQITQGHTVVDKTTWFVSFAPYDAPKYAVVVVVESGASGGKTCAPIAKQMYQALQKRDLVKPAGTPTASNANPSTGIGKEGLASVR